MTTIVTVLVSALTFVLPILTFADLDKTQHVKEMDSRWAQSFVRGGDKVTDISAFYSEWPLYALAGVSMNKNAVVVSLADALNKSGADECQWIVDASGSLVSFSDPAHCLALDPTSWIPSVGDLNFNPAAHIRTLWCSTGRSMIEPRPPVAEVARAMSFFQILSFLSLLATVVCSYVVSTYIPLLQYNLVEFKNKLKSLDKTIHFKSLSPNFSEIPINLMYRGTFVMLFSWAFLALAVYFGFVAYKLRYSMLVLPFMVDICRDSRITALSNGVSFDLFGSLSNVAALISSGRIPRYPVDTAVELTEIFLYSVPVFGAAVIVKSIMNSRDRIARIGRAGAKKIEAICAEIEDL